jgi:hypothetical protein
MHLRNPRRSTLSSFVSFPMNSDIIVFWLIGCGVPEHTRHQVHTDCDQELFLTSEAEPQTDEM